MIPPPADATPDERAEWSLDRVLSGDPDIQIRQARAFGRLAGIVERGDLATAQIFVRMYDAAVNP